MKNAIHCKETEDMTEHDREMGTTEKDMQYYRQGHRQGGRKRSV